MSCVGVPKTKDMTGQFLGCVFRITPKYDYAAEKALAKYLAEKKHKSNQSVQLIDKDKQDTQENKKEEKLEVFIILFFQFSNSIF